MNEFKCRIERDSGVTVVRPCGHLDSAETESFERELMTAVETQEPRVVLDLDSLQFVSSSGLRVLLLAAKEIERKGGLLLLCALKPQIEVLLETAGFTRLLQIRTSRTEAVSEAAVA